MNWAAFKVTERGGQIILMEKTKTTKKISTGPFSALALGRYGSLLPRKTPSVVVDDDRSIRPPGDAPSRKVLNARSTKERKDCTNADFCTKVHQNVSKAIQKDAPNGTIISSNLRKKVLTKDSKKKELEKVWKVLNQQRKITYAFKQKGMKVGSLSNTSKDMTPLIGVSRSTVISETTMGKNKMVSLKERRAKEQELLIKTNFKWLRLTI